MFASYVYYSVGLHIKKLEYYVRTIFVHPVLRVLSSKKNGNSNPHHEEETEFLLLGKNDFEEL